MQFTLSYVGEAAAIASAVSYAVGVIFFRLASTRIQPVPLVIFNSTVAVFFFALFLFFTEGWPSLNADQWIRLGISGLLGITVGDVLFMHSLRLLGAGFQAVVTSLYAPFIILIAFFMFHETLSLASILGVILVVMAIPLAARNPLQMRGGRRELWLGVLMGAISMFLMAYAVLMIRDVFREVSLFGVVTVRFFIANVALLIWALVSDQRRLLVQVFKPGPFMKWTFPGAFFGTLLAVVLWFVGFKFALAGKAAAYNQLSTIFVVILAAIFLKEPLTLRRSFAVGLAFTGALIVGLS